MLRSALVLALALGAGHACAASAAARQDYHKDEQAERDIGYSEAVRVGDTLYISGHVGTGEMPAAIRMAYDSLKKTLAAHGLDFRNVVKENLYATDLDALIANRGIRRTYYEADSRDLPAATWVGVKRLYVPEIVLEVELVAVFPRPAGKDTGR